jgi:hypothetical protein
MRAIQRYYRKFGRYPSRLEDLENTNNIRFLRKRYKDPMSRDPQTGREQDFKLMHPQDVLLNNGPVTGQVLGQLSLVGQAGSATGAGGSGQGLGSQGAGGVQNALGQMGGLQTPQSGLQSQNTGSLDNSDSSNSGTSSPSSSGGGSGLSGQVFGGGPIVGVASASKAKTIKEFNKKDHYNDWYFIYVYSPNVPVQGLLIGPWQPNKMIMGGDAIGQPIDGGGQGITQPANGQPPAGPGVSPQSLPAQQNQN